MLYGVVVAPLGLRKNAGCSDRVLIYRPERRNRLDGIAVSSHHCTRFGTDAASLGYSV